jgi:hypothetical protein
MSGISIAIRGLFSCSHLTSTGKPIMVAKYIHFLLWMYSVCQRILYGLLLTPFVEFGITVALSLKSHIKNFTSKGKQKLNKILKENPCF